MCVCRGAWGMSLCVCVCVRIMSTAQALKLRVYAACFSGYEALKTVRWQDENRIQATTQAIFGKSKDESKWSHGGLLLSDVNQALVS